MMTNIGHFIVKLCQTSVSVSSCITSIMLVHDQHCNWPMTLSERSVSISPDNKTLKQQLKTNSSGKLFTEATDQVSIRLLFLKTSIQLNLFCHLTALPTVTIIKAGLKAILIPGSYVHVLYKVYEKKQNTRLKDQYQNAHYDSSMQQFWKLKKVH